jgi:hypothetical protein
MKRHRCWYRSNSLEKGQKEGTARSQHRREFLNHALIVNEKLQTIRAKKEQWIHLSFSVVIGAGKYKETRQVQGPMLP